jgi:multidrug efflux pump subunit AcrA (membrane-fusion protein)
LAVVYLTQPCLSLEEQAPAQPDAPGKVVPPKNGDAKRVTTQPATIQAYESVRVFSQVSGVLKKETVDIGDRVKQGQVLAVLNVPSLEAQRKHDGAVVALVRLRVQQAESQVIHLETDLDVAKLAVLEAEAAAKSAAARVKYREKQWQWLKQLFDANGVDERVVEESKEQLESAVEAEHAARAAVATAKARGTAALTRIEQAKADLMAMQGEVKVA